MGSRSEITSRFAKEEDLTEILHLFAKGMRGYEVYPYRLFWIWKHLHNPFGPSPVLLALHGERIVGIRAFMRWKMTLLGKPLNAFRAVDTVTDPDYQGQGIFKRLTLEMIDLLKEQETDAFVFNTPNNASRPGYLKMGWKVLGRAPVYIRWVPWVLRFRTDQWEQRQAALERFRGQSDESVLLLPGKIQVRKDLAYMNWRYRQYPVKDYGLDIIEHKGKFYYFFLKIKSRRQGTELRICDIWVNGEKNWKFIASHSIVLARQLGCGIVSLLPEPAHLLAMLQNGFLPVQPFANIITVRDINCGQEFERVGQLPNWAFAMGDLELF